MDKEALYRKIREDLHALIRDCGDALANYANASALLYHSLPNVNWAGFYFFKDDSLVLGPFQGKPACIFIAPGKGVCGTAFSAKKTLIVEDVHQFPGHISCDARSRSEIVVPLIYRDSLYGVLDIDSPRKSRFDAVDAANLEQIAALLLTRQAGFPECRG
ncbi:MAG: GAF domain-containing protein [Candidatus Neomarinimicrobiota bacterium]|jgi:GAF domain-containing protein|nr:GAF domain-containing protein [Candidatus Neomarinimicrobiota bacterium]MDD3966454.1 GAF domain-containing protein [Candidatus Neomarinimicrobiota bacterium]MDX9779496.1 GAF domain-containing protein [bacterium]